MKRHSPQFERQTRDDEHQTEHQHLMIHLPAGNGVEHVVEVKRAGGAVKHRKAVEQKAGSECAQHKVFHRRFGGDRTVAAQGHQRVAGERE